MEREDCVSLPTEPIRTRYEDGARGMGDGDEILREMIFKMIGWPEGPNFEEEM